jgi:hypothetical protein
MTPRLDRNATTIPISRVTIGTLEDLGYTVDYEAADSYTTFSDACKCGGRDLASTDETTTMTTTHQVDETRHNKRSLNDPNHPDAYAIAKAKEILASMIVEAPGPDEVPPVGGNMMTRTQDPWISIVTYDTNTETTHSYIITAGDVGLLL